ncbi:MAG: hypothetical protein ACI8XB_002591 [Patiriisocius sp.]|jgi:hypothetical protein
MNMIPFYWDQTLIDLPDNGWDWMLQKGVEDYESNIKPNTIGGLQIIIPTEYQSKGHSEMIINIPMLIIILLVFPTIVAPLVLTLITQVKSRCIVLWPV